MKARLAPVYFKNGNNEEFKTQVEALKKLLSEEAAFTEPAELGEKLPDADAAVFPVLIGDAYRQTGKIREIKMPVIALTSEFGTVAMWDWEIITFLKSSGIDMFAPYGLNLAKAICRALAVKKELKKTKFLVYQDRPGDGGMQPEIFKRFYWWEDACIELMQKKFGVTIIRKSYRDLSSNAAAIGNEEAASVFSGWNVNMEGLTGRATASAAKMYAALERDVRKEGNVGGVGINCLNESAYADTTPCLAFNMLFEHDGILWACEGDIVSLITKYIICKSLKAPVMMSNMYPFLMGMAALKHEKIQNFPDIDKPDNCILVAHCGYFGLVPRCFACEWKVVQPVLAIVNENSHAINARIPIGDVTIAKLHPGFEKMQAFEGILERYVQYPGSDCMNGGIIRVKDGHKLMNSLYSHHMIIATGHRNAEIELVAKVFGLETELY